MFHFSDSHLFSFAITILSGLLLLLFLEKIYLLRNLRKLHWRVQVTGTRGKSSVTDYIVSALQDSHFRASGKITGIIPTYIAADRCRTRIKRRGPARIQEQYHTILKAVREGVNTLVLEAMAIDPELLAAESRIFRPNMVVLTNIREDHFESLGSNREEQAAALINAIPKGVKYIISNEKNYRQQLANHAVRVGAVFVQPDDYVTNDELSEFPAVFAENVNLAIEACVALGLSAEDAKKRIFDRLATEKSDLVFQINAREQRQIRFINAFAVNDIPSLKTFLQRYLLADLPVVALVNTRRDRPLRTVQFADWLSRESNFQRIIITGNHCHKMAQLLKSRAVPQNLIYQWDGKDYSQLIRIVDNGFDSPVQLVGLANIAGPALTFLENLKAVGFSNVG